MRKLLGIKDYILLSSAFVGDVFDEIRSVGDVIPWVYKTSYGFVPEKYKKQSYLSMVSRMLSDDLIERKLDKKGEPYLELTSLGKSEFRRRFPIFTKQKGKWDGYFMQIIFDIPEKERKIRESLRLKLKELGFGMIQESVFISPYHFEQDLKEFLDLHELSNYIYVMSVSLILTGDLKKLAERVWKIDKINEKYLKLLEEIEKGDKNKKELQEEYFLILEEDPFLPKEFLPDNWIRDKVAKKIA